MKDCTEAAVYKIENIKNGKVYIGSSLNPQKRYYRHNTDLKSGEHHCIHLQRAWNKYGSDAFTFDILEIISDNLLIETEQKWINHYLLNGEVYNTCLIAENCMGVVRSEEFKANLSQKMTGRKHTEKSIEKMRQSIAQEWTIITPDNQVHHIKNLFQFCIENNLDVGSMSQAAKNKRPYKKWVVLKKIDAEKSVISQAKSIRSLGKKSKTKGTNFERHIASTLTKWSESKVTFMRNKKEENQYSGFYRGDVVPKWDTMEDTITHPILFCIECKDREEWGELSRILLNENKYIPNYWSQALEQADGTDLVPLLIFTKNYHKPLIMMTTESIELYDAYNNTKILQDIKNGMYNVFMWGQLLIASFEWFLGQFTYTGFLNMVSQIRKRKEAKYGRNRY